jgi:hypothetical protein
MHKKELPGISSRQLFFFRYGRSDLVRARLGMGGHIKSLHCRPVNTGLGSRNWGYKCCRLRTEGGLYPRLYLHDALAERECTRTATHSKP